MKRFRLLLPALCLTLLFAFCLSGCTVHRAEPETAAVTPLFWEVTSPDGTGTLYLFGSVHVAKPDTYPLPDAIEDAFASSDCLAVEFDTIAFQQDPALMQEAAGLMIYTDGTTIRDHLDSETYELALAAMKDAGLYKNYMEIYRPAMWCSLLDSETVEKAGYIGENGIDVHFLTEAHETGKRVVEVESALEQYRMLTGFSEETDALLLKSSCESVPEEMDELYAMWCSGDEAAFTAYVFEEPDGLTDAEREVYAGYVKTMFDDRNDQMAKTALELVQSGETCFFVVGTAHMLGERGIVSQLRSAGCEIIRR